MSQESGEDKEKKVYAPRRNFPVHTLEDALPVARAIQDKNAGKPIKPFLLAEALGISAGSSNFREITSSAYKYGLTQGIWSAGSISLTPVGIAATKPTDKLQETKALQEAVLNIDPFKRVYEYYLDNKLPVADTYFKNKIESDFGIPKTLLDDFLKLLIANGRFYRHIEGVSRQLVCHVFRNNRRSTSHRGLAS